MHPHRHAPVLWSTPPTRPPWHKHGQLRLDQTLLRPRPVPALHASPCTVTPPAPPHAPCPYGTPSRRRCPRVFCHRARMRCHQQAASTTPPYCFCSCPAVGASHALSSTCRHLPPALPSSSSTQRCTQASSPWQGFKNCSPEALTRFRSHRLSLHCLLAHQCPASNSTCTLMHLPLPLTARASQQSVRPGPTHATRKLTGTMHAPMPNTQPPAFLPPPRPRIAHARQTS